MFWASNSRKQIQETRVTTGAAIGQFTAPVMRLWIPDNELLGTERKQKVNFGLNDRRRSPSSHNRSYPVLLVLITSRQLALPMSPDNSTGPLCDRFSSPLLYHLYSHFPLNLGIMRKPRKCQYYCGWCKAKCSAAWGPEEAGSVPDFLSDIFCM